MHSVIKGMVQVAGSTCRTVPGVGGRRAVQRNLHDQRAASTQSVRATRAANGIEPALPRDTKRAAIQGAKTSWVGHLALG